MATVCSPVASPAVAFSSIPTCLAAPRLAAVSPALELLRRSTTACRAQYASKAPHQSRQAWAQHSCLRLCNERGWCPARLNVAEGAMLGLRADDVTGPYRAEPILPKPR